MKTLLKFTLALLFLSVSSICTANILDGKSLVFIKDNTFSADGINFQITFSPQVEGWSLGSGLDEIAIKGSKKFEQFQPVGIHNSSMIMSHISNGTTNYDNIPIKLNGITIVIFAIDDIEYEVAIEAVARIDIAETMSMLNAGIPKQLKANQVLLRVVPGSAKRLTPGTAESDEYDRKMKDFIKRFH